MRPKERLGIVDLEATTAALVAEAAQRLDGHVGRIRLLGALALALCQLADGRVDGVATLKPSRSVDLAAAALIVREAGATLLTVDGDVLRSTSTAVRGLSPPATRQWAETTGGRWCTPITTTYP